MSQDHTERDSEERECVRITQKGIGNGRDELESYRREEMGYETQRRDWK